MQHAISVQGGDGAGGSLFNDEATRTFYEDLKDLRLVVPPVLLKGCV